jgi:hypothetical protein
MTPESEQGAVLGTFSSMQTLARMISYTCSNLLLGMGWTGAPYAAAFGVDALALVVASTIGGVPRAQPAQASATVDREAQEAIVSGHGRLE